MLQKSDVEISDKDIDRAHRIASKRTVSVDGKKVQQIIVKFFTWQKRNVVYPSRKVVKEKFGYSVRLDLTKKKLDLLKRAREFNSLRFPQRGRQRERHNSFPCFPSKKPTAKIYHK